MDSELVREGNEAIKRHFLGWRDPPVDLPADSVIDAAVMEIVLLAWTWNDADQEQKEGEAGAGGHHDGTD